MLATMDKVVKVGLPKPFGLHLMLPHAADARGRVIYLIFGLLYFYLALISSALYCVSISPVQNKTIYFVMKRQYESFILLCMQLTKSNYYFMLYQLNKHLCLGR